MPGPRLHAGFTLNSRSNNMLDWRRSGRLGRGLLTTHVNPPPLCLAARDNHLARLESAVNAVEHGAKPKMIKPKGASDKVDEITWLRQEVKRLEAAVLEARERAIVFNSTPSYFVLFRSQKAAGPYGALCIAVARVLAEHHAMHVPICRLGMIKILPPF